MLDIQDSNRTDDVIAVIPAYMISTTEDKWSIDEQKISQAISSLNIRNMKLLPVVSKATRTQMVDSSFIDQFSIKTIETVKQALSIK